MRFRRVLFIRPDLRGPHGAPAYPHPGIGFLMASLEREGVKCDFVDMYMSSESDLRERLKDFNPDLVGLTIYSYRRRAAYAMIRLVRTITRAPIVIGGPHVSLFGKEALLESASDFAIKNEGEISLPDLCSGKPFSGIRGLIHRDAEGRVQENDSLAIDDLDTLPHPTYPSSNIRRYAYSKIPIVSSRGCPFHCIYCSVAGTMGRKFRSRSPESVLAELGYWHKKGYRRFDFIDDTFAQDRQRILDICEGIKRSGLASCTFGVGQGMRAHLVDRPLLLEMYAVGFRELGFGVESANDHVLRAARKGQILRHIHEAVHAASEIGFEVGLFFMVGMPGETASDVRESFSFALKYPVRYANFYNIIPYPGTELYNQLQARGSLLADPDDYLNEMNTQGRTPLFATPTLSIPERLELLEESKKISRQVERRFRSHQLRRLGLLGRGISALVTMDGLYPFLRKMGRHALIHKTVRAALAQLQPRPKLGV